jgi:hypothetical protein
LFLQVLGALLRHQAVRSAGTLLAWTLQRPELIDQDLLEQRDSRVSRTLSALWHSSHQCLGLTAFAVAGLVHNSSSGRGNVGTLAAAMTQQLGQSGG